MKRFKKIIICAFAVLILLTQTSYTKADEYDPCPIDGAIRVRVTCYCTGEITADGSAVREGIAAYAPEYLNQGYVAMLFNDDGEFFGYYELKDTGFGADPDGDGVGTIQEGKTIDIYRSSLDRCYEFTKEFGDWGYVVLVKGVG